MCWTGVKGVAQVSAKVAAKLLAVGVDVLLPEVKAVVVVFCLVQVVRQMKKDKKVSNELVGVALQKLERVEATMGKLKAKDFPQASPAMVGLMEAVVSLVEQVHSWEAEYYKFLKASEHKKAFAATLTAVDLNLEELLGEVAVGSFEGIQDLRALLREEVAHQRAALAEVHGMAAAQRASATEIRAVLAAAAEKQNQMASALEGMKAALAAGAPVAEAAAAAAEKAAAALSGGTAMALEATAELRQELLEDVAPAMLDALEKEGALTREAVVRAKEEILGKMEQMDSKIDKVHRSSAPMS